MRAVLPKEEATLALGRLLGRDLFPGGVVGLTGPLGAGKTTLVRGIADGMGLDEGYTVSSPTFTLLQSYPCRDLALYHLDLYRVAGPEDLDSTGYRDALGSGGVLVVEWADRVPSVLPEEHLIVEMEYSEGSEGRTVTMDAVGEAYEAIARGALEGLRKVPGVLVDTP